MITLKFTRQNNKYKRWVCLENSRITLCQDIFNEYVNVPDDVCNIEIKIYTRKVKDAFVIKYEGFEWLMGKTNFSFIVDGYLCSKFPKSKKLWVEVYYSV